MTVALAGCDDPGETTQLVPPDNPLQQVVYSEVRPPAISGGTLLVTHDGKWAVAADPDRDRVVIVNAESEGAPREIVLGAGDEPGRLVEDATGVVHVALRRGGALLAIDPTSATVLSRRDVCSAPRGVAVSELEDEAPSLVVACAGGELVEIAADPNGAVLSRVDVEPDLRDVVVSGTTRADRRLLVSTFRTPKVLTIGPAGEIEGTDMPGGYTTFSGGRNFSPTVAWRMVADAEGGALMVHQRSSNETIEDPGGSQGPSPYAGVDCNSALVLGGATRFDRTGRRTTEDMRGGIGMTLLPVDAAIAGDDVAIVSAGSDNVIWSTGDMVDAVDACEDIDFQGFRGTSSLSSMQIGPEPVAVAFRDVAGAFPGTREKQLFVQLREPPMIVVFDAGFVWNRQTPLGGARRYDTGHRLFHASPDGPTSVSCASCHPEGRDDGHVWVFEAGPRRTQNLAGGILETAPLHWAGDLGDMGELMKTVFEERMGNQPQSLERVVSVASWIDQIPRIPPKTLDADAVARGKAIFERADVACTTCHSGAAYTNNQNADIGFGEALQVPRLTGVRDRGPYMHDGCAPTLRDRFDDKCGGTAHGDVSMLSSAEIDDLVIYMSSL